MSLPAVADDQILNFFLRCFPDTFPAIASCSNPFYFGSET
jgi:hypothetical protein